MIQLQMASAGNAVRQLQEMLNLVAPTPPELQTDGVFGAKTRARVVQFQTASNLTPDGIVGPLTSKALVGAVLSRTFSIL